MVTRCCVYVFADTLNSVTRNTVAHIFTCSLYSSGNLVRSMCKFIMKNHRVFVEVICIYMFC
jgi:hypothetical protein